jgi:hypothetical protein
MKSHEILQRRHEESQRSTRYYIEVNVERTPPATLFRHEFWANQTNLKKGDILRCVASDGSYDFEMRVNNVAIKDGKNIVTVGLYPIVPDFILDAAESGESVRQMTTHVNGKPVPRVENAGADGWRVVGFAGEIVSRNHASQASATMAMAQYINGTGIADVAEAREAAPGEPAPAPLSDADRPNRVSFATRKKIDKRQKVVDKRAEIDARNKARTAERLAAEAGAA